MSENINTTKRRSAIRIMGSLIGLVKPLLHIMLAAIILGTLGYLLSLIHISEPTRPYRKSRMPSSA